MTPVLIDLRLRTMLSNNEFHDTEMEHGDDFWDLYPRRRVVQMLMAEPSPGRGRRFEAPYETSGGETFPGMCMACILLLMPEILHQLIL